MVKLLSTVTPVAGIKTGGNGGGITKDAELSPINPLAEK